jgi:hypothetical protein
LLQFNAVTTVNSANLIAKASVATTLGQVHLCEHKHALLAALLAQSVGFINRESNPQLVTDIFGTHVFAISVRAS